jgi:hypothetical protein
MMFVFQFLSATQLNNRKNVNERLSEEKRYFMEERKQDKNSLPRRVAFHDDGKVKLQSNKVYWKMGGQMSRYTGLLKDNN